MQSSQLRTQISSIVKQTNSCHWSHPKIQICKEVPTDLLMLKRRHLSFSFYPIQEMNLSEFCVDWETLSACRISTQRVGLNYSSWRSTPKLHCPVSASQTAWKQGHWQTENNAQWLVITHLFVRKNQWCAGRGRTPCYVLNAAFQMRVCNLALAWWLFPAGEGSHTDGSYSVHDHQCCGLRACLARPPYSASARWVLLKCFNWTVRVL